MKRYRIVIDSNVWVSALRSRAGASFKLLSMLDDDAFTIHLSGPLLLEYEDTARRLIGEFPFTEHDIDTILDVICDVAHLHEIHFSWRPHLPDSKDDLVLEVAVNAQCDFIVTFNKKHFTDIERFGLETRTPREFLKGIGAIP